MNQDYCPSLAKSMFLKLKVKDAEFWRSGGIDWWVKIGVYLIAYNEMKKEKN